jgi:hypothetical protein
MEIKALNEDEFTDVVRKLVEDAEDFVEDDISWRREKSWKYYHGESDLSQPKGRSGFVMSEVRDVVDGVMPDMMDIFTSTERVGEYLPNTPEQAEQVQAATKLANHILLNRNNGWTIIHDAILDGLVAKTGIVKSFIDTQEDVAYDEREGVTLEELELLASTPEVTVEEVDLETMSVKVKVTTVERAIVIEPVPPEEFLIDRKAMTIEDAVIVGQRSIVRAHQLVERGFDREKVMQAASPQLDQAEVSAERQIRQDYDTSKPHSDAHWATKEVQFYEVYVVVDRNGDGVAETHQVYGVGDQFLLLESEEVNGQPYSVGSPMPKPHAVIGDSLAERVWDLQDVNSQLVRNVVDNTTLVNNPRYWAVESQVNMTELQDNRYNGIVRARAPNMIGSLAPPSTARDTLPVLEFFEGRKEMRTGVSRAAMGLDPDALQSSSEVGVRSVLGLPQKKLKLYARSIAETLLKPLFKRILVLMTELDAVIFPDGDQFQEVDPGTFDPTMQVMVRVGLGTGDREEKINFLMGLAMKQEQILLQMGPMNPVAPLDKYAQTLSELIELSPLQNATKFINPPEQVQQMLAQQAQQQQEPPPDPEKVAKAQAIEAKMQAEQQKLQAEMQKMAADLQMSQQKAAADADIKRQEMEGRLAIERWKAEQEIELRQRELTMEARLEEMKIKMMPEAPGAGEIRRNGA